MPVDLTRVAKIQTRAVQHYEWLKRESITIGVTRLEIWGHNNLHENIYYLPDGSVAALINLPNHGIQLQKISEKLIEQSSHETFELPWDGRVILLWVSADGQRWTMWNDWIGSIPVFHAQIGNGRIASTLEPVTVAGAGYSPHDFFLPGMMSLLINGHYISDWTLYKRMHIIPPDSCIRWDEKGFRATKLWTVKPTQSRWEAGWDDLVDEMYELSKKAIIETLRSQPEWVLPLSSGLDSRLIAAVAAEVGANVQTYAWGGADTTDVNYSRQIAQALGLPWAHVRLKKEYLAEYTPRWADHFGSAMTFHGMYQMCFFDALREISPAPVISGFFGDVLAGDVIAQAGGYQIANEWSLHWSVDHLRQALKIPYNEALEANRTEIQNLFNELPGAAYQNRILLEAWNNSRLFTSFQAILKDYWRGVATPFMNREYARFCLSLPRAVTDNRRLLMDVFRRHYGRLAVIPGTYANEPMILTGKYLILRRLAQVLSPVFHHGPLRGFGNVQLRMDIESVQALGRRALWPLFDEPQIGNWLDVGVLERDFQTIMQSKEDIRPLRRLQAAQVLAYRLSAG